MTRKSRPDANDSVEIGFESIEHQTEKAVLFAIDNEKAWLPKSQIENLDDILAKAEDADSNDVTEVQIPKWLAVDHGWDEWDE